MVESYGVKSRTLENFCPGPATACGMYSFLVSRRCTKRLSQDETFESEMCSKYAHAVSTT